MDNNDNELFDVLYLNNGIKLLEEEYCWQLKKIMDYEESRKLFELMSIIYELNIGDETVVDAIFKEIYYFIMFITPGEFLSIITPYEYKKIMAKVSLIDENDLEYLNWMNNIIIDRIQTNAPTEEKLKCFDKLESLVISGKELKLIKD